jgi:exodeoxyribonuclease III
MQVATWNVNSLRARMPHVLGWLTRTSVDVLALQETKCVDVEFPRLELEALGYQLIFCGQRAYNGVAVVSRSPCSEVVTAIPGFQDEERRVLAVTTHGMRVVNLYVPNGQAVGSPKYAYKLRWLAAVREWLAEEVRRHERLVVLGDFNIAPEDRDVHDPAAWAGSVHVSEPERQALRELLAVGLIDAFRQFEQPEKTFTWWDYRMLAFRRNQGLRIDLILVSPALAALCRAVTVDREPRKAERPSDHAPVVATFEA